METCQSYPDNHIFSLVIIIGSIEIIPILVFIIINLIMQSDARGFPQFIIFIISVLPPSFLNPFNVRSIKSFRVIKLAITIAVRLINYSYVVRTEIDLDVDRV